MQIATQGYRVIFEPEARCFDPQANEPAVEKRRKQRTLAGNFQMLFRYPQWLFPWKNRLWWQLISHKYLRIIAPLFLGLMLIKQHCFHNGNTCMWPITVVWPMRFLCAGRVGGAFCPGLKIRVFSIPAAFCFLNLMTIGGLWNYGARLPSERMAMMLQFTLAKSRADRSDLRCRMSLKTKICPSLHWFGYASGLSACLARSAAGHANPAVSTPG